MIEATYALNEYLLPKLQLVDPSVSFVPGSAAPESAGHNFILYRVNQNTGVDLFMYNTDLVQYKITNVKFDTLKRLESCILKYCNIEDPEGVIIEPNIRYQFLHATSLNDGTDFYPDNTEYYFQNISLDLAYTVVS